MFLRLLRFELVRHARQPATWVFAAVLFGMAALLMAASSGAIEGGDVSFGERVQVDGAFALTMLTALVAFLGALVVAAVAGGAAQRDFATGTHALVFTTGVSRRDLLGARFVGALVASAALSLAIPVGLFTARWLPGTEPERLAGHGFASYVAPYVTVVLPGLVLLVGLFFAVGLMARRMLPVYLAATLLLLGYLASAGAASDVERRTLGALLDPFAIRAVQALTEYWPTPRKNGPSVPLAGLFLWNRLLWAGVGLAALGVAWARFRLAEPARGGRQRRRNRSLDEVPAAAPLHPADRPATHLRWGGLATLGLVVTVARREFALTVRSGGFVALALGALGFLALNANQAGTQYGTEAWPVTYQVLELFAGQFCLFGACIVTFYAGEAVWRERDARLAGVADALPVPTVVPLAGKVLGLIGVLAVLQIIVGLGGMVAQAAMGYFRFEPGLYAAELLGFGMAEWALFVVLAVTVHAVVDQKVVGHVVIVAILAATLFESLLGTEHNLLRFGGEPGRTYSDMNGYGPFVGPWAWFMAFWAAVALALLVAALLLWRRGPEDGLRARLRAARGRWTRPVLTTLGVAVAAMAGLGAFLVQQTTVANDFVSSGESERRRARYERQYKRYETMPQPSLADIALCVDLYPERGGADIAGRYRLVNRTDQPLDSVVVYLTEARSLQSLTFSRPARAVVVDDAAEFRLYRLARPLAPGDSVDLSFRLAFRPTGIRNRTPSPDIAANGSFLSVTSLPVPGYQRDAELSSPQARRRQGLPVRPGRPPATDAAARQKSEAGIGWIRYRAVVSTSGDQTALAPGERVREWAAGGRRFAEYRSPVPALAFWTVVSARYAEHRQGCAVGGDSVAIRVFHHPTHTYNVERMAEAACASLAHYARAYGPYPLDEFRIAEFPRYGDFAQAYLGTIPFSESVGFIARVGDEPDDVDYPYYITAHEAAHQWWAHQAVGADVQGASMLTETLAQYSALRVMEGRYGRAGTRRFLAYERDGYLIQRGTASDDEQPLGRVEGQPYVYYQKGGIVLYGLADLIGRERVDLALRRYLARFRYAGPPYPVAADLVRELRRVTSDSLQYAITDGIERITFHTLRTLSATAEPLPGGRWRVRFTVEAAKSYADGQGREAAVPMRDWVDVAVLDADGDPLYLRKHRLTTGTHTFSVVVPGRPHRAGADPFARLIEQNTDDNVREVAAVGE